MQCMENNDIAGMYAIVHELHNTKDDKGVDLTSKGMELLEDDHQEWHGQQVQGSTTQNLNLHQTGIQGTLYAQ